MVLPTADATPKDGAGGIDPESRMVKLGVYVI
jgi:hypothetical protein